MSPGGAAALVVIGGALKGHRYDLIGDAFVIGREQQCDLLIDDTTVSRKHALLQRVEEKWFITDTSKNGTHVNSRRVTGALALTNGDKIAISTAAQLEFVGSEDTVPLCWRRARQSAACTLTAKRVRCGCAASCWTQPCLWRSIGCWNFST